MSHQGHRLYPPLSYSLSSFSLQSKQMLFLAPAGVVPVLRLLGFSASTSSEPVTKLLPENYTAVCSASPGSTIPSISPTNSKIQNKPVGLEKEIRELSSASDSQRSPVHLSPLLSMCLLHAAYQQGTGSENVSPNLSPAPTIK